MRLIPKALAPKLLAGTLAVTLAVVCVMSIALFANSAWIVDRFLNDSVQSRSENLAQQFELQAIQAIASLEREIDSLARDRRFSDLQRSLDESASELTSARSIQAFDTQGALIGAAGTITPAAPLPQTESPVQWQPDALLLSRDIVLSGRNYGQLRMAFSLTAYQSALEAFRERQLSARRGWQSNATMWVLITSLIVALLCGAISWLAARRLVRPIEAITRQARRMQLGDYGQPLHLTRDDELGELATAFDSMRDQLRQTTISRDYMDSLLSSMNDAVIVTGENGIITHCNTAAVNLTGYTETQLLGMPITNLVADKDRTRLVAANASHQPREARFITKDGSELPVSWTASDIESVDTMLDGRIYTAQNISERKRAEERIRYLARMDPMTKVPNRMQFQHLLQRAIARARRSNHVIGMLYLDVDQFKDINDTFGHLAGDTTLEVLTNVMRRALPEGAVIGRLAGDEFAAFIDEMPKDATVHSSLK
ncbi:MAG: diguanylate cyclase, partial [Pseudomonadota bacterium]